MYLAPSASALMQFPRASKDLLIFDPSLNLAPLFPVTAPCNYPKVNKCKLRESLKPTFSLPARSIRLILATLTSVESPASLSFSLMKTCSTAWDLLLSLLASVAC